MLNKVILMGRFTRDPELRSTPQGISTCSFSIAVDRNFVRPGEERKADFINCVAWRQTAEFISRYFSKGKMIALEGTLRTGSYTDRNYSDVTHYTTDVYVENVEFCGDKGSNNSLCKRPSKARVSSACFISYIFPHKKTSRRIRI